MSSGSVGGFVAAIEFHLELFIEAEGLLPAFEFVAGLLCFFFVRELENHIGVGHIRSLRCDSRQVKKGRMGGMVRQSYKGSTYFNVRRDRCGLDLLSSWLSWRCHFRSNLNRTETVIEEGARRAGVLAGDCVAVCAVGCGCVFAVGDGLLHQRLLQYSRSTITRARLRRSRISCDSWPAHEDCGHDMAANATGMSDCSMDCCQEHETPAVGSVTFVMPPVFFVTDCDACDARC